MPVDSSPVFISYSSKDLRFVQKLAKDLVKKRFHIWWSTQEVKAGQNWPYEINKVLYACRYLIVILSPNSVASPEVWKEFVFAEQNGKQVIPVLYRECQIPYNLYSIHNVDFTQGYSRGFDRLLRELGRWKKRNK